MQEKDMVSDILSGVKASLATYAKVITESNDPGLRQTFQQMRDGDEKFQYDLYKIAASKGYYHPAPQANQLDISGLKNILSAPA
ncbi:MAG: spore coat protein [Clostridiales bacterium]|jgi:spore coat protein CotF|nr:spore coat protein [Clostridiales bacterium]